MTATPIAPAPDDAIADSPTVGVLLSGGLDSAILAGDLLRHGRRVAPFYVRTGCVWQACELAAVCSFLEAISRPKLDALVELELPLADLYADHWSITGHGYPDRATPDDAVFLPGRNPLLLTKPAIWCRQHGITQLALATLMSNPFSDATPEFFAAFEEMIDRAMGARIETVRPFERLTKKDVMQLGRELPLALTFSCLAPVDGLHCGRCNKCAERQRAFGHLESGDPTRYAAPSAWQV